MFKYAWISTLLKITLVQARRTGTNFLPQKNVWIYPHLIFWSVFKTLSPVCGEFGFVALLIVAQFSNNGWRFVVYWSPSWWAACASLIFWPHPWPMHNSLPCTRYLKMDFAPFQKKDSQKLMPWTLFTAFFFQFERSLLRLRRFWIFLDGYLE